MADFQPAFDFIMQSEDAQRKYQTVSDPTKDDPTAQAISGINSAAWPEDFAKIAEIEPEQDRAARVEGFYLLRFWDPLQLDALSNQDLANRVLDSAVNQGAGTAIKILQQALNHLEDVDSLDTHTAPEYLAVDGAMGPLTIVAANECGIGLLAAFRDYRCMAYRRIGGPNLSAWIKRAER